MELISFYGNEIVKTNDVRKIERLKSQGFREIKSVNKNNSESKGDVKKNATRKGKTDTKRDI